MDAMDQNSHDQDNMLNFHKGSCVQIFLGLHLKRSSVDMLYYGILNLAHKAASQFADGDATLAMWKNSLADYHDFKKVISKQPSTL